MNPRIDIAALLEPIAAGAPCGEDLEYAPEFAALQVAAAGRPEQQVGELVVPATEPDWREVVERSVELLARTHDLRIACRLTQALLRVDGLAGLAAGLGLVRSYLQTHWDELFPRLDPEDDFDPAIRVNAVAMLCHVKAMVHPLREMPLLHSTLVGPISLRTIARAHGAEAPDPADAGEAQPGRAEIDGVFESAALPELDALVRSARRARSDALAIEADLARRVGAARALDFSALTRALADIDSAAAPELARRLAAQAAAAERAEAERADVAAASAASADERDSAIPDEPADHPGAAWPPSPPHESFAMTEPAARHDRNVGQGTGPNSAPNATPGASPNATRAPLRHRADVLHALDALCRYFAQHEPCHPAPILLERARRWVSMDYLDVLRDFAPEAAEQAERLRGPSHPMS